jgi:hypothetical protein
MSGDGFLAPSFDRVLRSAHTEERVIHAEHYIAALADLRSLPIGKAPLEGTQGEV